MVNNACILKIMILSSFLLIFNNDIAYTATRYVDKDAKGINNGTSWDDAWTSLSSVSGASAGDIVYISGGSTSKTYTISSLTFKGGSSGNPITYKVGQDAGHTGTAIITGNYTTLQSYLVLDGEYSGNRRLEFNALVAASTNYVTIRYITVDSDSSFNSAQYYDISYSSFQSTYDHAISFSDASPPVLPYGTNKIHHNTFILDQKNDGSGWGSDGFQWIVNADIYNNTFTANEVSNYPSGQHQDGVQTGGNSHNRIYNNNFVNMGNYAIFYEFFGNGSNTQIYNNVIYISNPKFSGGAQQAIAMGRSGGASGTITLDNIMVFNNTVANYGGVAVAMSPGTLTVWNSSCLFYNNVGYATGGFSIATGVTGRADPSNKSLSSGAASIFVDYANWDLHLKSTDSTLKDKGVNTPSIYFSNDKDGISRPQGSLWDIGAYETIAAKIPLPTTIIEVK